ncbi:uncharacterized protein K452DRAFT_236407 [Aplosporella prunicola CBS 121167]|uniref:FAD/NAD(P)-binding domain-containing protein n=1 Tax=Aplosporella prunicola CBS 121167 TaxID=1176127 RepID=A0A6A6B108_9PEZI|nr:uncharacterized protein K452DRAFT_236407 [Aplosporella prunicola CBS 121167]KAF2137113.1 hypothetical protein K452DRAFT_236407 [Aplosporella prunicola CBS 121167]
MPEQNVDALVVGAGFGGIYLLYELTKLPLSVKLIDMAGDVGGTWWYNRYPGAMSDTESYLYRYSWDKEDLRTYPWANHYLHQPEILKYLEHVVEKHGLRKYMQFNTEMLSADFDEDANVWRVATNSGDTIVTRFLFTSLGPLFRQKLPDFPGMDTFKGTLVHSQEWDPAIQLEGKDVAVIGSGSTGVQIVTAIAPVVKSLTSFQRSPQYTVPSGNGPVSPEYRQWINAHYDDILERNRQTVTGFGFEESTRPLASATPEEREEVFETLWQKGNGMRFMFGGFGDIAFDRTANEAACDFIRRKIASIVKDPEKARKLMPRELYARRPLCDAGYYEQFNRANVHVVDAKATPITAITPAGILTSDGAERAFDVVICATGFDAFDGAYGRIALRGRGGQTLRQRWADGARTYMGVGVAGFPNLFMVGAPLGPFSNFPSALEAAVELSMAALGQANGVGACAAKGVVVDVTPEAEEEWVARCEKLAEGSLFKEAPSWIFGRNIAGKPLRPSMYFGGLKSYLDISREVVEGGMKGYVIKV